MGLGLGLDFGVRVEKEGLNNEVSIFFFCLKKIRKMENQLQNKRT